MREQVTLEEILDVAAFQLRAKMYKQYPGIVVGTGGSGAVDVQPAVHDVRYDVDLGTRVSEPWQVIPAVPVAWPKFGPLALVGHLDAGDKVTLLSYDLDPTVHRGSGRAEDPADVARHSGAYWLAIPNDVTFAGAKALGDPGSGKVFLGKPGGVQVLIDAGAGTVSLGAAAATDAAALASILDSFMGVFLKSPADGGWSPVPNDGGAALKTALGTWATTAGAGGGAFSSVGSKTVKCAP